MGCENKLCVYHLEPGDVVFGPVQVMQIGFSQQRIVSVACPGCCQVMVTLYCREAVFDDEAGEFGYKVLKVGAFSGTCPGEHIQ